MNALARRLSGQMVVNGPARRLGVTASDEAAASIANEEASDFRSGFERGYADGMRSGLADAEIKLASERSEWIAKAQEALDQARVSEESARTEYLASAAALAEVVAQDRIWAEGFAVEIAYAAVVRLLGSKMTDGELIKELCRQARQDVGEGIMRMRVSPGDLPHVRNAADGIEVLADEALATGGCLVETSRGKFDASLGIRLDMLRQAFMDALHVNGNVDA